MRRASNFRAQRAMLERMERVRQWFTRTTTVGCVVLLSVVSCKEEEATVDEFEGLYGACESSEDCEGLVPEDVEEQCIGNLDDGSGFCTWSCVDDLDCSEEFDDDFDYLCASFESESGKFCFPGCREDDPEIPDDEVCPAGYECRSTGGGAQNRRICFPV